MNNVFLKAAKYQHDTFIKNGSSDFSCFTLQDAIDDMGIYNSQSIEEFYDGLYEINCDKTFVDRIASLQKKHWSKISEKSLNEVRVLALLFAHHAYNDDPKVFENTTTMVVIDVDHHTPNCLV